MKTANSSTVQECMTANVVTVSNDSNLISAMQLMDLRGLSAIPVLDHDNCVCGILSVSDVMSLTHELQSDISALPYVSNQVRKTLIDGLAEDNDSAKVTSAMNFDVKTISKTADLTEAAKRFIEYDCHQLPVVDLAGKAVGIISTSDIVRTIANQVQD